LDTWSVGYFDSIFRTKVNNERENSKGKMRLCQIVETKEGHLNETRKAPE
jgi:hypothetical protein